MKIVLQRVSEASVRVDGETVGEIGPGLLVLIGVAAGDTEKEAAVLAEKTCSLRIFGDEAGKMNLSVRDVKGSALVISQFTLLADTRRGRRPSFVGAAAPELARALYEEYARKVEAQGVPTQIGRFGAHMEVTLVNDGPVTLTLEATGELTAREVGLRSEETH
ncbi:MAG TPA: D-aminoacyl-tRNA deacylase [Armatimonadota bacterium]|nr:D-aminoacyl-tRNA deacylase [Armatimonadota bacterium]